VIHILQLDERIADADIPASVLNLATLRDGRVSDADRPARNLLAEIVGPGLLADLLRSGLPIRVTSQAADSWRIESTN
jgi:hypothetical protein